MLTDTYKPTKTSEILGQSPAIKRVAQFLKHFGKQKRCMVVTGMNGVGKSLVSNIVPKELGYTVKHVSEDHDLKSLLNVTNFFGDADDKVVIVYEACYITNLKKDIELFKTSTQPILIVADTGEFEKHSALRKNAEIVRLKPIDINDIQPLLKRIGYTGELPEFDGDLRSLLLNMERHSVSNKDITHKNIHKTIPIYFDYTIDKEEKYDLYFQDTYQVSNLLYLNYLKTKINPITTVYDALKKKTEKIALRNVINKAKKDARGSGQVKVKVKKPKLSTDDMNQLYKMTMLSESADYFTDADLLTQYTNKTHDYCLQPDIAGLYVAGCSRISGKFPSDTLSTYPPFTKKPMCETPKCKVKATCGRELGKPRMCKEHQYYYREKRMER
jgi:hypothetical protein